MRLKTCTNEAISILLYMAQNELEIISSKELADNLDIPLKSIKKILQQLKDGNVLVSERGIHGGYRLNMYLEDISLYDITKIMENAVVFSYDEVSLKSDAIAQTYDLLQRKFNNELRDVRISSFR